MQIIYRKYLADVDAKPEVMGCLSTDKMARQYVEAKNKEEGPHPWYRWSSEKTKMLRPIKHKPKKVKE
jgi:hypothetical protein